jgi:hypothetical protein
LRPVDRADRVVNVISLVGHTVAAAVGLEQRLHWPAHADRERGKWRQVVEVLLVDEHGAVGGR